MGEAAVLSLTAAVNVCSSSSTLRVTSNMVKFSALKTVKARGDESNASARTLTNCAGYPEVEVSVLITWLRNCVGMGYPEVEVSVPIPVIKGYPLGIATEWVRTITSRELHFRVPLPL